MNKNNLDPQYNNLLKDILENGIKKQTRNGEVLSVFGREIRHKMSEGFPILTSKHIKFDLIVSELLWFLQGRTDLRYLLEHNNQIWVGDAHKAYINHFSNDGLEPTKEARDKFIEKIKTDDEFAKKWGDLGPIYGKQWRKWGEKGNQYSNHNDYTKGIDQIANLIHDLKNNPDSRRLMVTAWNPADVPKQVLPPCHTDFQFYTRELSTKEKIDELNLKIKTSMGKEYVGQFIPYTIEIFHLEPLLELHNIPKRAISLKWHQRSVDTFLGLPFNIASYGLLLEIIAKTVNMVPDELIGSLGDTHLYLNHIEQAKEQIGRKYTEEERIEFLQQTGMDALVDGKRQEFMDTNIPKITREPFDLPTLVHSKTDDFYKSLSENVSLFGHLDIKDFLVENYQSHPAIKAPLSN